MKTRWYKDAFFYQIYPRSFCDGNGDGIGDLRGIISKLDYIKSLGVNAVWLSPCYKSPNDDNGYDISDYRDIMDEFGTMEDFDELIAGLHERGIRLIMDLVVNHTSDEHWWFKESRSSKANPYRDYYYWKKGRGKDGKRPPNNWMSNFLGPAWKYEENTDEWYLHLFSYKQPDLNWNNPKVRQEVADICNFWFEKGVDGFRCDVITYISKNDGLPNGKIKLPLIGFEQYCLTENYHKFIKEVADKSWNRYDTTIVGEAMGITSKNAAGYIDESVGELDCVFSFEHTNCDRYTQILPHKLSVRKLKSIFARWQALPKTCAPTLFFENHDQPRSVPRFVGYDVGEHRDKAAKMLPVALYMQRGVPFIFQGQELGMSDIPIGKEGTVWRDGKPVKATLTAEEVYKDILSVNAMKMFKKRAPFLMPVVKKVLKKVARDNARTPMQWSDAPNAGFCPDDVEPWMIVNPDCKTVNVAAEEHDGDSLLNYYRKLIEYRKGSDCIKNGDFKEYYARSNKLYVYERKTPQTTVAVVCNFTKKEQSFTVPSEWQGKQAVCKLCNYDEARPLESRTLRPFEAAVYEF